MRKIFGAEYIEYCEEDSKDGLKQEIEYNESFEEETKEDMKKYIRSVHENFKFPCIVDSLK